MRFRGGVLYGLAQDGEVREDHFVLFPVVTIPSGETREVIGKITCEKFVGAKLGASYADGSYMPAPWNPGGKELQMVGFMYGSVDMFKKNRLVKRDMPNLLSSGEQYPALQRGETIKITIVNEGTEERSLRWYVFGWSIK